MYPRFASTLAKVAKEYGIFKTRFPSEDMDEVSWMNDNPRKPFRQTLYNNVSLPYSINNRPFNQFQSIINITFMVVMVLVVLLVEA